MPLVPLLAKFFVQARAHWQRRLYVEELEGEGYLALTKAARTYDPKRLPYPKAYFARAIMNAMYKWIRRGTRQPGVWRLSLEDADRIVQAMENPDYLRLAVEDLGQDAPLAVDRFINGRTLQEIADSHQISLRAASVRSRELANSLAAGLDIRLRQQRQEQPGRRSGSSEKKSSDPRASARSPRKGRGRS